MQSVCGWGGGDLGGGGAGQLGLAVVLAVVLVLKESVGAVCRYNSECVGIAQCCVCIHLSTSCFCIDGPWLVICGHRSALRESRPPSIMDLWEDDVPWGNMSITALKVWQGRIEFWVAAIVMCVRKAHCGSGAEGVTSCHQRVTMTVPGIEQDRPMCQRGPALV
jgi:hypothetical protein